MSEPDRATGTLSDSDIEPARQGTATDPRVAAMVAFGRQVVAGPAGTLPERRDLRELTSRRAA